MWKFANWPFTSDEKQVQKENERWEEKMNMINRCLFHKDSRETLLNPTAPILHALGSEELVDMPFKAFQRTE